MPYGDVNDVHAAREVLGKKRTYDFGGEKFEVEELFDFKFVGHFNTIKYN